MLAAHWSEIDLERGVWTKPSHHTKQKRTQHLPLSAPAMALLSDWRSTSAPGEAHLFPGDAPGKPLQDIKNFWRADIDGEAVGNRLAHVECFGERQLLADLANPGREGLQETLALGRSSACPRKPVARP